MQKWPKFSFTWSTHFPVLQNVLQTWREYHGQIWVGCWHLPPTLKATATIILFWFAANPIWQKYPHRNSSLSRLIFSPTLWIKEDTRWILIQTWPYQCLFVLARSRLSLDVNRHCHCFLLSCHPGRWSISPPSMATRDYSLRLPIMVSLPHKSSSYRNWPGAWTPETIVDKSAFKSRPAFCRDSPSKGSSLYKSSHYMAGRGLEPPLKVCI